MEEADGQWPFVPLHDGKSSLILSQRCMIMRLVRESVTLFHQAHYHSQLSQWEDLCYIRSLISSMTGLSVGFLGIIAVSFPLVGVLFAIVWSLLYDYEASVRTACHAENFLPTVSSAIGGFTPQRYVWRICITLHTGLRFMLAVSYYNWYMRIDMKSSAVLYHILVQITIACHIMEIVSLVVLSSISSTDNGGMLCSKNTKKVYYNSLYGNTLKLDIGASVKKYILNHVLRCKDTNIKAQGDQSLDIHEYSFIVFMIGSLVYMLLSCILIAWTQNVAAHMVQYEEKRLLRTKFGLFLFNSLIFLTSVYLYFRHNTYCEPYIYSWFALCEYLVIFSNIAFHGLCAVDFKSYSITFLATEDLRSGALKNK